MKILFLVILIILTGGLYLYFIGYPAMNQEHTTTAPITNTNPLPITPHMLTVGELQPGTMITVPDVTLGETGYVAVYLDTTTGKKLLGQSTELPKGLHKNVVVMLSEKIKDADVVVVTLNNSAMEPLLDANGNAIGILRNVGMVMYHYEHEF